MDYSSLVDFLASLRENEEKRIAEQKRRTWEELMMKNSPSNHLFEQEFYPGIGMKSGGHGGLLIGDHYAKKMEQ